MSPDLSAWTGESRSLADRIVRFVDGSLAGSLPEPFETLALALHRFQCARCPVRASLVDGPVDTVTAIPAIPVDLFKTLPVGTVHEEPAPVTFLTSGTTGAGRGAHRLRSAALYEYGAARWAEKCVPGAPGRGAHLLLDHASHPESSLSHMMALLAPESTWHLGPDGVDIDEFIGRLVDPRPLFVGATAFALAELLSDPRDLRLPDGSVLMVTGGFKGRVHQVDAAELYTVARERLAPARVVTEYGMTELSSQLWGEPDQPYRPPPWLRVIAVDPQSEAPVEPGQPGQLRFVDLCNLDASVAIETLDQGVVLPDRGVQLLGRLTDAPARGCSLTVEDVWAARSQ